MNREERLEAAKLLKRSESGIYDLMRDASAAGQPRTLEVIAGRVSPLTELGYLAMSGGLELTSAGQEQLQAWKSRHGLEG